MRTMGRIYAATNDVETFFFAADFICDFFDVFEVPQVALDERDVDGARRGLFDLTNSLITMFGLARQQQDACSGAIFSSIVKPIKELSLRKGTCFGNLEADTTRSTSDKYGLKTL